MTKKKVYEVPLIDVFDLDEKDIIITSAASGGDHGDATKLDSFDLDDFLK